MINPELAATSESPAEPVPPTSSHKAWFGLEALRFRLVAVFVVEAIVLCLVALPLRLSFGSHLFADPAEILGIHYLLTHGYVPNRDFGYQYGLLSLVVERLWFAFFPATNISIQPLSILVGALLATGLARFARNLQIGALGIALLVLMLPFAIQAENPMFSLEGALLANGLAEQAGGRRDRALAFATASCLAKPVMGYFYGLILVLLIGSDLRSKSRFTFQEILEALAPAAATGVTLALLLAIMFGAPAVATTLLPLRGMAVYKVMGYGFFSGNFLYFPGVRIGYYFGTTTAFWLLASLWLALEGIQASVGVFSPSRRLSFDKSTINHEMVFTCAVLHVLFVTSFYGPPSSWAYYFYVLLMGVTAASTYSRAGAYVAPSLVVLALLTDFVFVRGVYGEWKFTRPSAETAGLWAPPEERTEWLQVQTIVATKKATLLVGICGGELLSDRLEKPVAAFLMPGEVIPAELARKARQVEEADLVVMPTVASAGADPGNLFRLQPKLATIFSQFHVIWAGKYFRVYANSKRIHPQQAPSSRINSLPMASYLHVPNLALAAGSS